MTTTWLPFEGSIDEILSQYPQPLLALARGEIPAIIVRRAYDPEHCAGLMARFFERGLLQVQSPGTDGRSPYINIGTSFGMHHQDREAFFAHAAQTRELFDTLFEGYDDPVRTMYELLAAIAPDKQVKTAYEPDNRLYGPAIFRIYHAETGHGPHFDSVKKRTNAPDYQIARFAHQFAAVLCLQNAEADAPGGEPFLYNCAWTPDIQQHLTNNTFHDYAATHRIDRLQVQLEPGDLYFFFTENIHEVPAVKGGRQRAVLATFSAMSPDDEEIFVWA
jgi:hypothetical protein